MQMEEILKNIETRISKLETELICLKGMVQALISRPILPERPGKWQICNCPEQTAPHQRGPSCKDVWTTC